MFTDVVVAAPRGTLSPHLLRSLAVSRGGDRGERNRGARPGRQPRRGLGRKEQRGLAWPSAAVGTGEKGAEGPGLAALWAGPVPLCVLL